jgi:hypothetical protein
MAFFVPSLILGFAQAIAAVGAVVGGVILSQSQRSSSSSSTRPTPTPSPSPGPKPTAPTQQYTAPSTPSFPTINRNVYSTTSSSGSGSPTPAASPQPTAAAPAPAPEPPPPPEAGPPPVYTGVKAAPIDTVVFVDEPFDPNYYEDVLFQDFGGQELLAVARNDTVNGQNISYQPFKDLGIIRDQYTPNSLLSIQETSDRFFANFLIRLNEKIPGVGNGPDGATVYLENEGETGNAIVEFINIESNEQVEIQILNAGIIEDIGI